ncbi:MAG: AraC family transcriptional regulator [Gemmatimonadaceae bacterium]
MHLDELRWSPAFEAQVSSWASSATLLLVLESGDAMLNVQADALPSLASLRNEQSTAFAAARPRPMERCAVFRFDDVAASASAKMIPPGTRRQERPLVQLSPRALLRFYWRRHALMLGYPSPAEHVEEDAVALLRHVTSRILREAQEETASNSEGRRRHCALAREAKALMAVSIADPHPIAQVARALHTSPFHLAHVFRTEVGSSPHKYLVQLRIIAALVQLRAGARDLSKLALELGFCHHSHFTAVFRNAVGYTPREVRRMLTAECIADLGIAARCS